MYFVYKYIFCDLLVSFGCLWNSFVFFQMTLGPFGILWGALASQGALLGVTLASILVPWDADGRFWGTLASQGELGLMLGQKGRPFPSKWASSNAPAHKK